MHLSLTHTTATEPLHAPSRWVPANLTAAATATMRADHTEIMSRIDRLADTAATVSTQWADRLARDLTPQLVWLSAVLLLHVRKEEEVLLPVLDTTLGPEDAAARFARMG